MELPYRSMLKEIYPGLRKVNCKIDYTVVNFDVEQGRIIIRENPKYLSLNEMYQVANSYPKGSKDFVNVFDIAVRMYPTDQVANLNAAAVALSQKDLNTAVKYMEKSRPYNCRIYEQYRSLQFPERRYPTCYGRIRTSCQIR